MIEVVEVGGGKAVKTNQATNHVYVVDVSGSMGGSLPKMRQHLKNTVSMITQPDDTFTIIYFSGKGQCGVVCENVPVGDITSVTAVQTAIDRWLTPIGLTGFEDPLKLAVDVSARLDAGKFRNFVMLTDGYDNQSSKPNIMNAVKEVGAVYQSTSFIEYGWYCDRDLIAQMASVSGGTHIFAEGYEDYEGRLSEALDGAVREPMVEVKVNKKAEHAIYIRDGKIVIVEVDDGKISVPESTDKVHSVVPKDVLQKQLSEDHLFLILYYATKTQNSKLVWRCLEALGDVALVDLYTNAFTRQELSVFEDAVNKAALGDGRFLKGKDVTYVPKEDVPTVLDLIGMIEKESSVNRVTVVTDSPYFSYARTTRTKEQNDDLPKFVKSPMTGGSIVTGVVFNSSRPNVSIQTLVDGTIELPENEFGLNHVPSKTFKNYTIIRDGILNVKKLPMIVSNEFVAEVIRVFGDVVEIINQETDKSYVVLSFDGIPVISRSLVSEATMKGFSTQVKELFVAQGKVKGIKHLLPSENRKTEGMKELYGDAAASWLSSLGVRDYGFSPKVTSAETTDFYMALELSYKVKGLSSLPTASKVEEKVKSGKKLTISEYLVSLGLKESGDVESLKDKLKEQESRVRELQSLISKDVYSMVLSKSWFSDVSPEENTAMIDFGNGYSAELTVEVTNKEIKI